MIGIIDESNLVEIWYVRSGVGVRFHVQGDFEQGCEGVAAVLAVGVICSKDHQEENNDQEVDARVVETVESHANASEVNSKDHETSSPKIEKKAGTEARDDHH